MDKKLIIEKYKNTLGLTEEEAIKLIEDDKKVDRMTKFSDINSDLSDEQKKAVKKAKQVGRKPTIYKFDTSKREKKENNDKRFLIDILKGVLNLNKCDNVEIINPEREIIFHFKNVKYKITLSAPRS